MDDYTLMRLSDTDDDDAVGYDEIEEEQKEPRTAEDFKAKYKEFYTDIKIDLKEDW